MSKFFLKIAILPAFILLANSSSAQTNPHFKQAATTTYKNAINWKPFMLSTVDEVKVPAPPDKDQTQKELADVKKKTAQVNEKIMAQIRYWDAGPPAYRWNEIINKLIGYWNIDIYLRFPTAWVNMAIYDATLAAWKAKYSYNRLRPFQADNSLKPLIDAPTTPSYPCEHSVTAAAAASVIAYFFPELRDSLMSLAKEAGQSRIAAGLQYPSDVTEGMKLGEQVAAKIIEQAKKDGAGRQYTGPVPKEKNLWHGEHPVGINVRNYKPIVLKSGDQFRPPPPPDFAKEMKEMKEFKQDFMSTVLALRWAAWTGFDIWTELANKKIFEEHLDRNTLLCAQIYALLHAGMYDAGIVIMDAKYAYWGIRPNQYDTSFVPLVFTPPFPGYPSGHATASSAAATILSFIFPDDKAYFKMLAQECANSRFYAGIHFRSDNEVGIKLGETVANYVIDAWSRKNGIASY